MDTGEGPLLRGGRLSRDFGAGAFQVLVRRAVVALGERRALARLALARRRVAARNAAVERAGLDLLLDERHRGGHALVYGPGHLGLRGDREVAPNVLEAGPLGPGEVLRNAGEPLHRLFTGFDDGFSLLVLLLRGHVRGG